ncbi:unnamed protein product [Calypogeia fissa]
MAYYNTNPRRLSLLGHCSFGVKSMEVSEKFYNAVFASFGITQVYRDQPVGERAKVCGWGYPRDDGVDAEPFTLFENSEAAPHGAGTHLCFNAPSREAVDAFYAAAIENGGRGDGAPGLRLEIHENYYTCFVYDPEGHRLEALYQWPVDDVANQET